MGGPNLYISGTSYSKVSSRRSLVPNLDLSKTAPPAINGALRPSVSRPTSAKKRPASARYVPFADALPSRAPFASMQEAFVNGQTDASSSASSASMNVSRALPQRPASARPASAGRQSKNGHAPLTVSNHSLFASSASSVASVISVSGASTNRPTSARRSNPTPVPGLHVFKSAPLQTVPAEIDEATLPPDTRRLLEERRMRPLSASRALQQGIFSSSSSSSSSTSGTRGLPLKRDITVPSAQPFSLSPRSRPTSAPVSSSNELQHVRLKSFDFPSASIAGRGKEVSPSSPNNDESPTHKRSLSASRQFQQTQHSTLPSERLGDDFVDDGFIKNDDEDGELDEALFAATNHASGQTFPHRSNSNHAEFSSSASPSPSPSLALSPRATSPTASPIPVNPHMGQAHHAQTGVRSGAAATFPVQDIDVSKLTHFREIEYNIFQLTKPYSGQRLQGYKRIQSLAETKPPFADELRLSGALVVLLVRLDQIISPPSASSAGQHPKSGGMTVIVNGHAGASASVQSPRRPVSASTDDGDPLTKETAFLPRVNELRCLLLALAAACYHNEENMHVFQEFGGLHLLRAVLLNAEYFSQFQSLDELASLFHVFLGPANAENCRILVNSGAIDAMVHVLSSFRTLGRSGVGQACVILEAIPCIVFSEDKLFEAFCSCLASKHILQLLLDNAPVEVHQKILRDASLAEAEKIRRQATGSSSAMSPAASLPDWCSGSGDAMNDMLSMVVIVLTQICQRGNSALVEEMVSHSNVLVPRVISLVLCTPVRASVVMTLRSFLSLSPKLVAAFREFGGLACISRILDSTAAKSQLEVLAETLQMVDDILTITVSRASSDQRVLMLEQFSKQLDSRLLRIFQVHEREPTLRLLVTRILLFLAPHVQDKTRTAFLVDIFLFAIETQAAEAFASETHVQLLLLECRVLMEWIAECAANMQRARRHAHASRWRMFLRREDVLRSAELRKEIERGMKMLFPNG